MTSVNSKYRRGGRLLSVVELCYHTARGAPVSQSELSLALGGDRRLCGCRVTMLKTSSLSRVDL
jgi:hypothetical protein